VSVTQCRESHAHRQGQAHRPSLLPSPTLLVGRCRVGQKTQIHFTTVSRRRPCRSRPHPTTSPSPHRRSPRRSAAPPHRSSANCRVAVSPIPPPKSRILLGCSVHPRGPRTLDSCLPAVQWQRRREAWDSRNRPSAQQRARQALHTQAVGAARRASGKRRRHSGRAAGSPALISFLATLFAPRLDHSSLRAPRTGTAAAPPQWQVYTLRLANLGEQIVIDLEMCDCNFDYLPICDNLRAMGWAKCS
jgi:hypothetical protein